MGITILYVVIHPTSQHEIHDLVRRLLGCCRRCPRSRGGCPRHPHLETDPKPRHRETRVLFQLRSRTVSPSARAESRSRSEINPKNLEPSPRANSLTPKTA